LNELGNNTKLVKLRFGVIVHRTPTEDSTWTTRMITPLRISWRKRSKTTWEERGTELKRWHASRGKTSCNIRAEWHVHSAPGLVGADNIEIEFKLVS
jgi:hypothetical protein